MKQRRLARWFLTIGRFFVAMSYWAEHGESATLVHTTATNAFRPTRAARRAINAKMQQALEDAIRDERARVLDSYESVVTHYEALSGLIGR